MKKNKTKKENWFILNIIKIFGYPSFMLWFKTKYYYEKRVVNLNGQQKEIKSTRHIKGKAIIVVNHASFFDPLLLEMSYFTRLLRIVIAKEVAIDKKFLYWLIPRLGCLRVNRGVPDTTFIKNCFRVLKKGQVLVLFPEGHISDPNTLEQFKKGAVTIALKTNTPIVPAYIGGEFGLFKRQRVATGFPVNPYDYVKGDTYTEEELELINKLIFEKMNHLKMMIEADKKQNKE